MSDETVQAITARQMEDLAAALIQGIPPEMPFYYAQMLIGDKKKLHSLLRTVLLPEVELTRLVPHYVLHEDGQPSFRAAAFYLEENQPDGITM